MKFSCTVLAILFTFLSFSAFASEEVEDFKFKDIEGKNHTFSEYKGKWVIVNYWGTYCPPCLEEIPDLISFSDKHKNDAVVLGLDAGGTNVDDLKSFAAEYMIEYLIAPIQESTLTAFGILMGIPTTYVITPKGEIAMKKVGVINLGEVEGLMKQYEGSADVASSASDGILDL